MRNVFKGILLCASAVGCASSVRGQDAAPEWFDGKPRTFVVNGYSTSYHWPAMLQRKLDRYFDGKRIIEVKSATQGSTPIAKWMNVKTGQPLKPWTTKLRPLLNDQSRPTIVLAQQSLQWAFGGRSVGIRDKNDRVAIRQGAEVMKVYTDLLKSDGADAVVMAMHIYKQGMEPEIGNERLSLAAFIESKPNAVFEGPDVWMPTSKIWPQAFQADKIHPNGMGAEVMAHHWFVSLLKLCGKEVPPWSEEEMQQAIKNPPALATSDRRPQRGEGPGMVDRMRRHDANQDGKITKEEFRGPKSIFGRFDENDDGVIDSEELSGPGQ
ncbi:EF hand [Rubripirellula lacrimiformis]|uniref:EF hand n=1 Tax=Rubripirellula lacrimiformis TaxID=1930273 RepID=A0A517N9H4_9BACT|nr:hypothetical protein [Rubripirellula lacrimiformis]QDT03781.1 EF hand [Rubripirellula lacrimiformis]